MKTLYLTIITILITGSLFAQKPSDTNVLKKELLQFYQPQLAVLEKGSADYAKLESQIAKIVELSERLHYVQPQAMRLALDDMKKNPKFNATQGEALYQKICAQLPIASKALYRGAEGVAQTEAVLELHRQLMVSNPLLDMDRLALVRFDLGDRSRKAGAGELGTPSANYTSVYSSQRTGINAEIAELSNLRTKPSLKIIYKPNRPVNIADLQIHWNADKLLFSSIDDNDRWQVYEVATDGSNFQQKVKVYEPDLDFCDANYLPDGRIIVSSNVGYHGVPCVHGDDEVGNLSLYDPKTGSFRRLTFDQDGNWNPVVTSSGRVMYTRWEYTDLTHYFSRMVFHMNPDGTENKSLYGSGSFFPNSIFDMKPLPGSHSKFIGVITGHHGVVRSGRLMIFDPTKSRKEEKGIIQELPFKDRKIVPEIKDYLVDGVWPQFIRPVPLDDNYFLVTAKIHPKGLWGVYLVDVFDNLTLVAEYEGSGLMAPLPYIKRPIPPVIPDKVNLKDKEATIFIQDIYHGEGTMGLPRGTVKELRIFAYEYAYWRSISDHDGMGIQSGWDIKRLLGTVPVEADGSVIFKVPAQTPISIQPLDEKGRALQWMRSWFTPMPGETVSCVGCHEDQNQIPMPKRVIASQTKPHQLKVPEGGVRPFTFDLEIQPILDRACVACHTGENGVKDLRSTETKLYKRGVVTPIVRPYKVSYLNLMPHFYRQGPEADMYVLKPYEYHASNSELIRMLERGHHGVTLTDKEWRTLYNWIDFNLPYSGSFQTTRKTDGVDQYERRIELANKYNNGAGVDWKKEITDYAAQLKNQGAIEPQMPTSEKTAKPKVIKQTMWPFTAIEAKNLQGDRGVQDVELAPGVSVRFVWIPAGNFVMGSSTGQADCRPELRAAVKTGFWMSETEITNQQYNALVPEHDSRVIGQFWKDHTTAGYPANLPELPVIRISLDEAMEYCQKWSKKSGLQITLPTETQWEWACRGGSNQPFWYGGLDTDFSKFENMADAQLSNMAVQGVDPKPMAKDNPLREFWDFLPKESSVDDGSMLATAGGKYHSNPWGLKDMHGNVAEWTVSDYVPYGSKKEKATDLKVVRGGAWTDRPIYSTSYGRKPFLRWQRPYNVGMRVIILGDL